MAVSESVIILTHLCVCYALVHVLVLEVQVELQGSPLHISFLICRYFKLQNDTISTIQPSLTICIDKDQIQISGMKLTI